MLFAIFTIVISHVGIKYFKAVNADLLKLFTQSKIFLDVGILYLQLMLQNFEHKIFAIPVTF